MLQGQPFIRPVGGIGQAAGFLNRGKGLGQAMVKGARDLGAQVIRNCRVTDTRQMPTGEWQVITDQGTITADHVVNAGGYHARQVGAMAGLDLPITTMQHHYVVTDAVPEFDAMDHEIPVTRDDYFCGYVRREQGSALIGLYDKQAPQAVWLEGCPWDSANELFEPNWEGITPWLENCFERMPALMNRGIKRVVNGGMTYTPDGAMMLGPAPGLRNYWLACGVTVGIAWGPGAEAWLNAICANRMPREGRTCLTLLLNCEGTIEGKATIARTGPDSFYFVTGAPSECRVWDWLTLHCGVPMVDVTLTNQTDDTGILCLAGPMARKVLSACSDLDVTNDAFRWLACKDLIVAGVQVTALRLSFTGELAYELHAPNDHLGTLWDTLWQAGQPDGIAPFGSKALDSLRLEKFYRGRHELANEAGHKDVAQERFAATDKDFVGKEAMLARTPRSRIALLALAGTETDALIGEAVFLNDELVGSITSAAYGHSVGQSLAIAFLKDEARAPGTTVEVSLLGQRIAATVLPDAPWDPANERLKR